MNCLVEKNKEIAKLQQENAKLQGKECPREKCKWFNWHNEYIYCPYDDCIRRENEIDYFEPVTGDSK